MMGPQYRGITVEMDYHNQSSTVSAEFHERQVNQDIAYHSKRVRLSDGANFDGRAPSEE